MVRAVTSDHIKFSECIESFRSFESVIKKEDNKRFYSYLLLDFKLPYKWQFPDFDIYQTLGSWNNQILLNPPYSAFVAPVLMPQRIDRYNGHLFTIALSSIISFCTGRSIKSIRDCYLIDEKITSSLNELAIQHPILTAGPGNYEVDIPNNQLQEHKKRVEEILTILKKLPADKYVNIFQTIRLIHLALLIHREDYDLSFCLLVAAIESIAQKAFDRKETKLTSIQLDEDEKEIEKLCNGKENLERWFKKNVLREAKLKAKYVEFIFKYAPIEKWYELKHPFENIKEYIYEISGKKKHYEGLTQKRFYEIYPSDIKGEIIRRVIGDTYKYRSGFFHEGKPTPHQYITGGDRFFENRYVFNTSNKENSVKMVILPKFELMFEISRISITEYMKSLIY